MAIIDFSDFSLKSVQSLFSDIEDFLNQDIRLECNKLKPERHLESVRQEIEQTRQRFDFHKNDKEDDFPSNKGYFKFLGLLTCKDTDTLKLRSKPLSLKSRSKGSVDLICRNSLEFQTYLSHGLLQRHHFASIQTQMFDPSFCLNGIFYNVAKLLNREITSQYEGTMHWLCKIDPKHYLKIQKLVNFYFRSQYLNINRYLLCKELNMSNMKNLLLAFSDGSRQFSTSVVYLVSYNDNGPEYTVNIVSSLSRLGKISQKEGEEGEESDMCTVPKRECHGLFLATCGVSSLANLLYQLKIPPTKMFIFSDAIAHIIALKKSPACFQLPYSRLYAEINSLTFQIGKLTSQPKEDIVRFLH